MPLNRAGMLGILHAVACGGRGRHLIVQEFLKNFREKFHVEKNASKGQKSSAIYN
tara:strand:- start:71 stop:235 length:165 start_codon:yes stop_codon:yes gene_type:complete